jgi:hypothetical protein
MRALAIADPSYFDLRAAAAPAAHVFTVRETYALARAAAQPLGTGYQLRMDRELSRRWLHAPAWPQKRDTYGDWGNFIAGKPSFGFIRYQGSLLDSWRLTGLVFRSWRRRTCRQTARAISERTRAFTEMRSSRPVSSCTTTTSSIMLVTSQSASLTCSQISIT